MNYYSFALLFMLVNYGASSEQSPRRARMPIFPVLTNYKESNSTLWLDTLATPAPTRQTPESVTAINNMNKIPSTSIISIRQTKSITHIDSLLQSEENSESQESTTTEPTTTTLRRNFSKVKPIRRLKLTTPEPSTTTTTTEEDYEDDYEETEEVDKFKPSSVSPLRNQILFHPRNKLQPVKTTSRPPTVKPTTTKPNLKFLRHKLTTKATTIPVTKPPVRKIKSPTPVTVTTLVTKLSSIVSSSESATKPQAEVTSSPPIDSFVDSETEQPVVSGWSNVESPVEESNYYGQMSEPEVEVADHWSDGAEEEVVVHGALL